MTFQDRLELFRDSWDHFVLAIKHLLCAVLGHTTKKMKKLRCDLCARCHTVVEHHG